jgi:transglutaminase-like putative cysteine protease
MRLTIRHETHYRYHRAVSFGRHRLVLRPREGHDVAVTHHRLTISPRHTLTWARDIHGNVVALVEFSEPATQLSFINEVTVARGAAFPERVLHAPFRVPWPPVYDDLEASVAGAYLAPVYASELPSLREWLAPFFAPPADDAEGAMLTLCREVHARIGYRRRNEKGVQSPSDTLRLASGSCRDMATLLMEAARAAGFAARFASGYLHASMSAAGRGSTHAWAEIYLPLLGWRGFDPTLGEPTDHRHVVTGVSNHPRGVMPISGSFDGAPADLDALTVTVLTTEESDGAASPPAD